MLRYHKLCGKNASTADNQQERLKKIGWIVGFTDGEGCFCISINRNYKAKLGWQVMPEFVITQGEKSLTSLKVIKSFFGCGRIYVNRRNDNHKENLYRYCVRNLADLEEKIIPFFKVNKLKTFKKNSFRLWSQVIKLMREKQLHLKIKGIERIAKISARINQQKQPKFLESSETIRRSTFS